VARRVLKADAERLACELEVDRFFANTGCIWTFDEGEPHDGYAGTKAKPRRLRPARHRVTRDGR
jgi:hypothetical protein